MSTVQDILRDEFQGKDNSFMIQLRADGKWDEEAFSRLTAAMKEYAKSREGAQDMLIERWIAEGYWYLDVMTSALVRHLGLLEENNAQYFKLCLTPLHDLAYWLFSGQSPYVYE